MEAYELVKARDEAMEDRVLVLRMRACHAAFLDLGTSRFAGPPHHPVMHVMPVAPGMLVTVHPEIESQSQTFHPEVRSTTGHGERS